MTRSARLRSSNLMLRKKLRLRPTAMLLRHLTKNLRQINPQKQTVKTVTAVASREIEIVETVVTERTDRAAITEMNPELKAELKVAVIIETKAVTTVVVEAAIEGRSH